MKKIRLIDIGIGIMVLFLPLILVVSYLYPDFDLFLLYPIAVLGYGLAMVGSQNLLLG